MLTIAPIKAFTDNYIWAILDEELGVFDCVDPGEEKGVLDFINSTQLQLRNILLTHHHNDHIGGVEKLCENFPNVIVYGPKDSRIPHINHIMEENQTIHLGKQTFQVLFNPGHTSTHISYYEPKHEWLFCGDTLFSAGCGRVFDGTLEELFQSLSLFKSLPLTTQIYCAHEYTLQNLKFALSVEPNNQDIINYYKKIEKQTDTCSLPSNLKLELAVNPFLRTGVNEVKNYALANGAVSEEPLEVFRTLRHLKNNF